MQGGAAHGAFSWGVLDALLEDGRPGIEAITGASAGAMNAVVLVEGWLEGGIDGACSHLETFWRRANVDGSLPPIQCGLLTRMLGLWSNQPWMKAMAHSPSPYETNPLNINPLREAINTLIDFDRVRACTDVEIFISATNVWTGEVEIFKRHELTADHLMASAWLLQQDLNTGAQDAVNLDGSSAAPTVVPVCQHAKMTPLSGDRRPPPPRLTFVRRNGHRADA
ncbi:MAG TPA: patatin-like phospholipase family protein [Mycobacterium sp.]|nr:patatin-like phospholipase family protein [Mycobacterium sp.]